MSSCATQLLTNLISEFQKFQYRCGSTKYYHTDPPCMLSLYLPYQRDAGCALRYSNIKVVENDVLVNKF